MQHEIESISILLLKARDNTLAFIKPILNQYDITEQQWRVIRELHRHGELNAQRLSEESNILSPSLSRILARFSQDGVIVRKTDRRDQRAQNIRLSAKGKRMHNKILPQVEKQYTSLSKALGADRLSRLQNLLKHVTEHAVE